MARREASTPRPVCPSSSVPHGPNDPVHTEQIERDESDEQGTSPTAQLTPGATLRPPATRRQMALGRSWSPSPRPVAPVPQAGRENGTRRPTNEPGATKCGPSSPAGTRISTRAWGRLLPGPSGTCLTRGAGSIGWCRSRRAARSPGPNGWPAVYRARQLRVHQAESAGRSGKAYSASPRRLHAITSETRAVVAMTKMVSRRHGRLGSGNAWSSGSVPPVGSAAAGARRWESQRASASCSKQGTGSDTGGARAVPGYTSELAPPRAAWFPAGGSGYPRFW